MEVFIMSMNYITRSNDGQVHDHFESIESALQYFLSDDGYRLDFLFPDGRSLYIHRAEFDEDEKVGFDIVKRALQEPIRQIAFNAGISADVVVNTVIHKMNGEGLDARTGKYVNMIESGIIDPAKVTRSAIQNAASI